MNSISFLNIYNIWHLYYLSSNQNIQLFSTASILFLEGVSIKPEKGQRQQSHLIESFHFEDEEAKSQGNEVTPSKSQAVGQQTQVPCLSVYCLFSMASSQRWESDHSASRRGMEAFQGEADPWRDSRSLSQRSCAQIKQLQNYSLFKSMGFIETIYY